MRRRIFSGVVPVDALLFDHDVADARLLTTWMPGSVASRLDDGRTLLVWPATRWLLAEAAPGRPLRRNGDQLTDHPGGEHSSTHPVQLLEGGTVCGHSISSQIDLSGLIDLSDWQITRPPAQLAHPKPASTKDGGPRAPIPTVAEQTDGIDSRSALGLPSANRSVVRAWRHLSQRTGRRQAS